MAKPPDPLPPEVLAAFQRRQPIEAIKLLLERRAGAQGTPRPETAQTMTPPPAGRPHDPLTDLAPGEVPRTGSTVSGWVVAGLVGYLAYRWLLD